jgi:hypothetical protein
MKDDNTLEEMIDVGPKDDIKPISNECIIESDKI